MRDAGIIGFVPRGEYSNTETYDFLHFVYYKGSTYVSKKETTGNAPAENSEYWQILARGIFGTPTVKQTAFRIKNRDLTITGVIGNAETDITDIIIKSYGSSNLDEGMRVGISPSNGMGYIQAQNFKIDCNLLTLEETQLLQTFTSIRFRRSNDSSNYPQLMPATHNFEAGMFFTNKDGTKNVTTKVQILSDSSVNYFAYDLPREFKNDTSSGNNLKLESKEWLVATGIDVKNRG